MRASQPRPGTRSTDHSWTTAPPFPPPSRRWASHGGWNIRFPRSIRELGVLYVCDEVVEASGGGSYVATGEIKRLIQ
ncbi:MAG TPA: hypothetical protein PKI03_35315 [Pseudomonadota bacterium]|nr:hypothetical protein [Pseudomonadota bacterium]